MNLSLLAQTVQSSCTLNGQPIDCGELGQKIKPFLEIGLGILVFIAIVAVASFVFWLLMLIHAIKHNSSDRNTWLIVLIISLFTGWFLVAALIYFFSEKKKAEQAGLKK